MYGRRHYQSMYSLVCGSNLFDDMASKLNITDNIVQRNWKFLKMNSVHINIKLVRYLNISCELHVTVYVR